MKTTDLRIRNIIYNTETQKNEQTTLEHLLSIEEGDGILEEVPLTEEWLIKFGFELLCRKSIGFKDTVFSMQKPSWSLIKLDKGWGVSFWQGNSLLYVHQLQNLYFALTNKELTL